MFTDIYVWCPSCLHVGGHRAVLARTVTACGYIGRMSAAPELAPAPTKRFGARAILAAVALLIVAVPFALLLFLVKDKWGPLAGADSGLEGDLHTYAEAHSRFVDVMQGLSTLGSTPVYLVVFVLITAWLLWRRLPRLAIFVGVTVAGSSLLNSAVKFAVDRARPVLPDPVAHAGGNSFPSGHAQAAIVGYSVFLLVFFPLIRKTWRTAAMVAAALIVLAIGFSRIALGVHFLTDVVGGYVLGAAWVAAMTAAFSAWRQEQGRTPVEPKEGLEPEAADQLAPPATTDN